MEHVFRHRGVHTLSDRVSAPVHDVPFEPPAWARALRVHLSYDRTAGTIDLGCEGPDGFRGWSGGAREEYTIAPEWATPGYLPGEPEPGTWRVLLGLYRVPEEGLPYEVTISAYDTPPALTEALGALGALGAQDAVPPGERPPPAAVRRGLPGLSGLTWAAGDLHAHTVHSDGALTVPQLAGHARDLGLDFLAVTDHNTTSHHPELPAAARASGVTLIPGQEVTTDLGHANAFGEMSWIDFRRPPETWAHAADAAGGVLSINHPVAADCAWRHPPGIGAHAAEIWHWSWWDRTWGAPLAWAGAWSPNPVMLGGSDFHRPEDGHPPGSPTTWILAEDPSAPASIVNAIRAGRTAVSASPDGPLLLRHGPDFLVLDAEGLILWGPAIRHVIQAPLTTLPAQPGPHRLETPRNEIIALCT
ncbi:CehA/McbA family metallohydrolase [Spongiactinospora sp. TRM90649]|uniref:CehA/McbA family metallohydrolase n=1 Tax=Spongiactinospora sp. TRM90649 TaxID=3031114 RepID=UPI0023F784AA|nr:CehA/McbA family metallohydrolase [Spongiactinospora sp. TRM90649]MDF5753823.1 CehA/McbA family metallohydrolase [Spongiactinospora sp. TRM90649]